MQKSGELPYTKIYYLFLKNYYCKKQFDTSYISNLTLSDIFVYFQAPDAHLDPDLHYNQCESLSRI